MQGLTFAAVNLGIVRHQLQVTSGIDVSHVRLPAPAEDAPRVHPRAARRQDADCQHHKAPHDNLVSLYSSGGL